MTTPPFRTAEFDILFNEGISRAGSVIDMAVAANIIEKRGSWFSYNGERLGQGKESVREELKNNNKLLEELEAKVFNHYREDSEESPEQQAPAKNEKAKEMAET